MWDQEWGPVGMTTREAATTIPVLNITRWARFEQMPDWPKLFNTIHILPLNYGLSKVFNNFKWVIKKLW